MSNNQNQSLSTYTEVLDYLYKQLPMFQRVGGAAFKKDLTNTIALCEYLQYPQHKFKSVHVAGTNGKGSSSHYIASILQASGYKTGLYTSPHLKSFTERIKINGQPISEDEVIDFVNRVVPFIDSHKPSFFELTVGMAFEYFASQQVDIAVIEVGMGGRLDSTNVIQPEVALITNISEDHKQFLGDSIEAIAGEKAGIIKQDTPVVISERQTETTPVFEKVASERHAKMYFAEDQYGCYFDEETLVVEKEGLEVFRVRLLPAIQYQAKNVAGVLQVIDILRAHGFEISSAHIKEGLENVTSMAGLKGRWQILAETPLTVCDVGHNKAGVQYVVDQLAKIPYQKLHMVWGAVNDKEIDEILQMLPKDAYYYFCEANIPRALSADILYVWAKSAGLQGTVIKDVNQALAKARSRAHADDIIFIGGSTFVVAEIAEL